MVAPYIEESDGFQNVVNQVIRIDKRQTYVNRSEAGDAVEQFLKKIKPQIGNAAFEEKDWISVKVSIDIYSIIIEAFEKCNLIKTGKEENSIEVSLEEFRNSGLLPKISKETKTPHQRDVPERCPTKRSFDTLPEEFDRFYRN
ncbi:MAG: hypothetical protein PHE53_06785 [Thermoguttaceae bacterium]|nr:hypothetical protein [Thermoguttaceae bacterium]